MNRKKKNSKSFDEKIRIIFKKIGNYFKNMVKEFKKIPQKWQIVILVWVVILLLLIIFIVLGSSNNKHLAEYENIENEMSVATEKYLIEKELYPTQMKQLNMSLDALLDYDLLDEKLFDGKTCIGYTKSYYSDEDEKYIIHPYLNCKNYTTKGYKDNK